MFYKQIEELRKMLRQYAPNQSVGNSGVSSSGAQSALMSATGSLSAPSVSASSSASSFSRLLPSASKESTERYARLSTFFRQFLRDSKKFYRSLLNYHLKVAKVQRVGGRFRDMLLSRARRRMVDDVEVDLFDDSGDDDEEDVEADESSVSNLSDHEGADEQQHHSHSSNEDNNTANSSFSLQPSSSSSSFSSPSGNATLTLSKLYTASELSTMQLALLTCHRSLIFLGDLERYSQLILGPAPDQPSSSDKDWRKAERYYRWALALMAINGNPHNQLAVVATYKQNNLLAVHRYFRSIAVKQPFATAMQNLKLLFDKANAACFDSHSEVMVRLSEWSQPQWMGASALMRLWKQATVRPLLQVASLQTAVSSERDDSLVYASLLDVIPPFPLRARYAAHQQPVRITSEVTETASLSSSSPATVDLLVTGDHQVWASPTHQPRHFDLVPAAQLVGVASASGRWNIQTSASIDTPVDFHFTLPSLPELLQAASEAGVDISQLAPLSCLSAGSTSVTFSGAAMDAWVAFVGLTLATHSRQPSASVYLRTVLSKLACLTDAHGSLVFPHLATHSNILTTTHDELDESEDGSKDSVKVECRPLHSDTASWTASIYTSSTYEPRLSLYRSLCGDSSLPLPAWLWQLSARQLLTLLRSASHATPTTSHISHEAEWNREDVFKCDWCGAAHPMVASIVCGSQQRADQLHSLAVHAGLPCQLCITDGCFLLRVKLSAGGVESVTASATFDERSTTRDQQFWCVTTAARSRVVMVRSRSSIDSSSTHSVYSSCFVGNCSTSILHQQHLQHHPPHKLCCPWYEPGMATVKLLDTTIVHLLDVLYTGRNTDSGVCLSHAVVARLEQLLLVPAAVAPVNAQAGLTGQRSTVVASGGVSVNLYCLQLLLDGIFCVHQHVPATNIITSDDKKDPPSAASASPPATPPLPPAFFIEPSAGSLSFLFLFDFVRSLLSCMSIHHPASLSWLGIAAIWCDWLHLHPSFIDPLPTSTSPLSPRSQPSDEPPLPLTSSAPAAAGVSSAYLDHERVVFSRCWHSFAHACNVLTVAVNSTAVDVVEAVQLPDQPPLREELEVYGFSYLSAAYPSLAHDFYWRRSDPQSIAELTGAVSKEKETHSPQSVSASTVVSGSVSGSGSGSSSSGSVSVTTNGGSRAGASAITGSGLSTSLLPPSHKSRAAVSGAGLDRKQYRRAVKVLRFADFLLTHNSVLKQDQTTGHFYVDSDIADSTLPLARVPNVTSISAATNAALPTAATAQPAITQHPPSNNQQRSPATSTANAAVAAAAATATANRPATASAPSIINRSSSSTTLSQTVHSSTRSQLASHAANHTAAASSFAAPSHQQQQAAPQQPLSQVQAHMPSQQQQQQQQAAAMAAITAHIQQQQQQQQQPGTISRQRPSADRVAASPQLQAPKHHAASSHDGSVAWRDVAHADRTYGHSSRPLSAQFATNASHLTSTAQSVQRAAQQAINDDSVDIDAVLERRLVEERQRQWMEAEHDNSLNQQTFELSTGPAYTSHLQAAHGPPRGLLSAGHTHNRTSRLSANTSSMPPVSTAPMASSGSRYRPPVESGQNRSSSGSPPLFGVSSSARGSDGWENYRGSGTAATTAATGLSNSPQPAAEDERADASLLRGWTPFDSQSSHPLSFLHQSLFSERGPSFDVSRVELLTNSNQPGAALDSDRRSSSSSPSPRSPSPVLYSSAAPYSGQPGAARGSSPPPPGFRAGLLSSQQPHNVWAASRLEDDSGSGSGTASDSGSGLLSRSAGRDGGAGSLHGASHSRISGGSTAWSTSIGQQLTTAYSRSLQPLSEPGTAADGRQLRDRYMADQQQYDAAPADDDWAMMDDADRLDQQDVPIGLEELLDDDGMSDHNNDMQHQLLQQHHHHHQHQQQSHYLHHSSVYQLPAPPRSHLHYESAAAAQSANQSQSSPPPVVQPYRPPHLQPHRQPPLPRSQPLPPSSYQQHQQHSGQRMR